VPRGRPLHAVQTHAELKSLVLKGLEPLQGFARPARYLFG